MTRKLTTEEFIEKARNIHGDFYDYSKVEYKNSQSKVTITCPIHGDFEQIPNNHLRARGCILCKKYNRTKDKERFVEDAVKIHGDKYDYSKVEYKHDGIKVTITCPIHGDFEQRPNDHLNGKGCKKCGYIKNSKNKFSNKDEFIQKAKEVHDNKYDYSKVEYKGSQSKVTITCPIHGDFEQTPNDHLNGKGCPECWKERIGFWKPNYIRKYLPDRLEEPCTFYILECYSEDEQFIKVGITTKTLEERYHHKSVLNGYQYNVLYEYHSTLIDCSEIEEELLSQFKNYQYEPEYKFCGSTECIDYRVVKEMNMVSK